MVIAPSPEIPTEGPPMNAQQIRTGWYSDPAGMHELRFFDDRWTERVADAGIETYHYYPTPPEAPAANSRRRWLVATGVVGLAAVAATVLVRAHSESDGSSFCSDYAKLAKVYAS